MTWSLRTHFSITLAVCLGSLASLASCAEDEPSGWADVDVDASAEARDGSIDPRDASEVPAEARVMIAAADGEDSAPGTLERPTSLTAALSRVVAGGTVYLRGGTYPFSDPLTIARDNNGSAAATKTLSQYQREAPLLDFAGGSESSCGLVIEADYWQVVGLIVRGAADAGIYVAGSHNRIERCATFQNRGPGLQLGASSMSTASDNLILNCESFDNDGENADGFSAKVGVGRGNVFRGCVAHHNLGDGWDLDTDTDAEVTIDQCVAHTNCSRTDGTHSATRDCTGFKLGGAESAHVVTRSIAYFNDRNGFSWSGNCGALRLSNTLAFDNSSGNYAFGDATALSGAIFTNDVSVWVEPSGAMSDALFGGDLGASNRFWFTTGSGAATSEFASMLHNVRVARTEAGDLDLSAFALAPQSALIDAGVVPEGTLPFDASYYRGNPDLGAVETP
ncbi:MAG TPA: right-handed parallel beta-helix repeat-containing protein [Polyangiales bacterium]|nr:right-handed parallel beta-helix repeat-containing protein [Polyangiales bacterium]